MNYDDYVECMRALTEDFLPNVPQHSEGQMPGLYYQVNLLRHAAKEAALRILLEAGQTDQHWPAKD
ncbi:MAG TPA: hypothetical protein VIT65_10165 [Microlunatus sp.]